MMLWLTWATCIMQWIILALVGANAWAAFRVSKINKATLDAIRSYRTEIGWLTARIEMLEQRLGQNGNQKGGRG